MPMAIYSFLGFTYPMGLIKLLYHLTGSLKFWIASFKTELSLSQVVDRILISTVIAMFRCIAI